MTYIISLLESKIVVYENEAEMELPWLCDFGENTTHVDVCGFVQDTSDDLDWLPNYGNTPSRFTGPPKESFEEQRNISVFNPL